MSDNSSDCFIDFVRTQKPDYCIAPEGWFSEEETYDPDSKSKPKKPKVEMVHSDFVTETERKNNYTERKQPKTTAYVTSWALRKFNS